jgi:hypothetical protein
MRNISELTVDSSSKEKPTVTTEVAVAAKKQVFTRWLLL